MDHKQKSDQDFKALMIPVVIVNGIIGGIVSVITSYFFKPIWNRVEYWNKKS